MKDQIGNTLGSVSSKSLDLGRKYGTQDETNKNNFYCNFRGVRTMGGAYRLKQHLAGRYRNTLGCKKVPEHVRKEIQDYMELKKSTKEAYSMFRQMPQDFYGGDEDEDGEWVEVNPKSGKLSSGGSKGSNNMHSKRKSKMILEMMLSYWMMMMMMMRSMLY